MLDGFEAREKDKRINDGVLRNLMSAISQELTHQKYTDYNIPALAIGHSGKSLKPHQGLPLMEFDDSHTIEMDWANETDEEVFGPLNGQEIGFSEQFYLIRYFPLAQPSAKNALSLH